MSNVKAGEWGATKMVDYAINVLKVTGISKESLRKGITRELRKRNISGKGGKLVFPEKRAIELLSTELADYIGPKRTIKPPQEEARDKEAARFIANYNDQYADRMSDLLEADIAYMQDYEDGLIASVSSEELFFAEMRLMFDYMLRSDKKVFDRESFQSDYRKLRQIEHEISMLTDHSMDESEMKQATLRESRRMELTERLTDCDNYVKGI